MKLILFTNSYPYGIGEMWKHNELKLLASEFSSILVLPLHHAGNKTPKKLEISNVKLNEPILDTDSYKLNYLDLFLPFVQRLAFANIKELVYLIKRFNKKNLIKFFNSTKKTRAILNSEIMQEILSNDNSDTILYFYWGLGSAEILPLIDVSKFKKVVVRMHRYDLYEYENDNYIPFRKQLLNKKLIVLPCSDDGTNHLKSIYKNFKATIQTQRLGVIQQKKVSTGSSGDLIRIVSCSSLVEVKRVDKMLKVASELNIPFVWVHIGGGQLQAKLQKEIIELNIKDKFILIGEINSELIIEFLVNGNFDLFVNTSRSEGVPVSIMEAFSVGIPVIATDAGGTREIVDETVGHLMENDFDHNDLKDSIERYNNLSKEEKNQLRQNAITRCYNKCNMEKLTLELVEILNK